MRIRRMWGHAVVVTLLLGLVIGRWWAQHTADTLWARSLGVEQVHGDLASLRLVLAAIALLAAATWCLANLYFVYRSIGSVHVPRRLGNLEFVEALPPRSLLLIVVVIGFALAAVISHGAADWWRARALADAAAPLGLVDPVLRRDLAYYVFELPWERTTHAFMTLGTGLMLAVCAVLYAAVGAVRWTDRRLRIVDDARVHLGVLAAAFALALFWGYRLEPAEYVAGIHDVPLDAIVLDVRLPAARLLSALALVVVGASLLWAWTGRLAVLAASWLVLALVSFAGHYVVPAFAAAIRPSDDVVVPDIERVRDRFTALAYQFRPAERTVRATAGNPAALAEQRTSLALAPAWDAFAVVASLNGESGDDAGVSRYQSAALVPLGAGSASGAAYVAVREPDFDSRAARDARLTWRERHAGAYRTAEAPVAVLAHRASASGLPLFLPDADAPEAVSARATPLAVTGPILFSPRLTRYAVLAGEAGEVRGVPVGGLARRVGLAWLLQSPSLLRRSRVSDTALVVWDRAVASRLERYAPFAEFGAAYPAVAEGRLYWMAPGYVPLEGFPVAPRQSWQGDAVRSVSAGLVGVVDAASGATRVFSLSSPDPVTSAWARLAPQLVQPAESLVPALRRQIRYPLELFQVQVDLARGALARRRGDDPPAFRGRAEAQWWVGPIAGDAEARLRLVATITRNGERVEAILAAWMEQGEPRLSLVEVVGSSVNPEAVMEQLALVQPDSATLPGALRLVPLDDGVLAMRSDYHVPPQGRGAPRLTGVTVGFAGVAAEGSTPAEAIERIARMVPPDRTDPTRWLQVQQWFERLDVALRAADWAAIGRAYDTLRRLLGLPTNAGR